MTKTKYEFSSQAWVDCAHEILIEAAGDTDLSGIEVTFSEVFTDAPKHLDPDDQGRIGWYMTHQRWATSRQERHPRPRRS